MLATELSDLLYMIFVLAEHYGIDLEEPFVQTINGYLTRFISARRLGDYASPLCRLTFHGTRLLAFCHFQKELYACAEQQSRHL
jgi:hypothetical protein